MIFLILISIMIIDSLSIKFYFIIPSRIFLQEEQEQNKNIIHHKILWPISSP